MKYISRLFLGLATALLVAACGGGGGGSSSPTLPADAVTITAANADAVANAAAGTLATVASLNAVDANALPSTLSIIKKVASKVFDRDRRASQVATGIQDSYTYNCLTSGTVVDTYDYTNTSASGTIVFNNCTELGATINGRITYSSTWNNSTGNYTDTASGSITYIEGTTTLSFAMSLTETGNENSGDYSLNMSYSVSGIPGGGFLVTTTQNIVGNYFYGDVYSGQLMVQGAGGSRLRITVTSTNFATVELDPGTGVFAPTTTGYIYLYYY